MTTKNEKWVTVWVVMASPKLAAIYGPVAGVYSTEAAANEHAADDADSKVVEWAASDRYQAH